MYGDREITTYGADVPEGREREARGFTLVEVLIVIGILGILGAVSVIAVRGTTERSAQNACATERRVLSAAAASYLAHAQVDVLPASGAGADRYELGLVDAGFIKGTSDDFNLAEDGELVTEPGADC